MKRFFFLCTLAVMLGSANAEELDLRVGRLPDVSMFAGSSAAIIHVPEATSEAERDRRLREDQRWSAYCAPLATKDNLGVTRLAYAHEGCEFGRTD